MSMCTPAPGRSIGRDSQPNLILLDINMLHAGRGWNTLDALKLHPKTRDIPIVLCSTEMRLVNEKAALLEELGCRTLEKPYRLEALLTIITDLIGPPHTS